MISYQEEIKGYDPALPMHPQPFTVKKVMRDTVDTFTLELEAQNGLPFYFAPGQFNMLYVYGMGEVPISICGDPLRPETLVHTVRAVGSVTRPLVRLRPGDRVGVRGPFGSTWPVDTAVGSDVVIVAGGIGLPPLRPAIYHILANRDKYGKVVILYGARTPGDLMYTRELEQWRGRLDLQVEVTVDSAPAGWRGNVGVVTTIIPSAKFDPTDTVAMMVGPEIMMRFVLAELQKRNVPNDSIYLSMERNMKCGVGLCGHCQFGPSFVCKEGPVYRYDQISRIFGKREI